MKRNNNKINTHKFTINNKFKNTLSSTKIKKIPPTTNNQTINLKTTHTNKKIKKKPKIHTTHLTKKIPHNKILKKLNNNINNLFLNPISNKQILIQPINITNNIINQKTNKNNKINNKIPNIPPINNFKNINKKKKFPTPTFTNKPQTNFKKQHKIKIIFNIYFNFLTH